MLLTIVFILANSEDPVSSPFIKVPGEGDTLIFSYICRLGSFFFWFNILNFNIFWGFQKKMNIFEGIKILWIFFGGHHKIGLY